MHSLTAWLWVPGQPNLAKWKHVWRPTAAVNKTSIDQLLKVSLILANRCARVRSMDLPRHMHSSHIGRAATGRWLLGFGHSWALTSFWAGIKQESTRKGLWRTLYFPNQDLPDKEAHQYAHGWNHTQSSRCAECGGSRIVPLGWSSRWLQPSCPWCHLP